MNYTRKEQHALIKFLLEEGEKPVGWNQSLVMHVWLVERLTIGVGRLGDDGTHVFKMSLTLTWPQRRSTQHDKNIEEFVQKDSGDRWEDGARKYSVRKEQFPPFYMDICHGSR